MSGGGGAADTGRLGGGAKGGCGGAGEAWRTGAGGGGGGAAGGPFVDIVRDLAGDGPGGGEE